MFRAEERIKRDSLFERFDSEGTEIEPELPSVTAEHLRRVNVIGLSGSGKSTFAHRLSDTLGSEYIEMDRLFHGPNWTEPTEPEFRERISDAILGDRWILDGNYHSKTHDLKWKHATSIVWLNTPFVKNLWRSTSRAIKRAWTKEELWPGTGNRETFRKNLFSKQSMILWMLFNYHRIQRRYKAIRTDPAWSHLCFIELRSRRSVEDFVRRAEWLANDNRHGRFGVNDSLQ